MRFFNRVQTLREAGAVGGFLVGISVHVVHAELARRRRRRWLRLTATGLAPDTSSHQPNADAREAVARYYRQLDALGPKDRSIFVSRTIEGLTLAQVAEVHGLSVSTTQRRLNRATKRIALLVRRDPAADELGRTRRDGVSGADDGRGASRGRALDDDALVAALGRASRAVAASDGRSGPPPSVWHALVRRRAQRCSSGRGLWRRRSRLVARGGGAGLRGRRGRGGGSVAGRRSQRVVDRRARPSPAPPLAAEAAASTSAAPLTFAVAGASLRSGDEIDAAGRSKAEVRFSDGTRHWPLRGGAAGRGRSQCRWGSPAAPRRAGALPGRSPPARRLDRGRRTVPHRGHRNGVRRPLVGGRADHRGPDAVGFGAGERPATVGADAPAHRASIWWLGRRMDKFGSTTSGRARSARRRGALGRIHR